MKKNRAASMGMAILFALVLLPLAVLGTEGEDAAALAKVRDLTTGESITFEGTAFMRYAFELQGEAVEEEGVHDNSFEMWRFYFGVRAKLAPWLKVRFTTDVGPEKTVTSGESEGHAHKVEGESRITPFVKYAYFDFKLAKGLSLKTGVVGNPYHSFTDKFWGYRHVFKNLGDQEKLWNSADLGLTLGYELPRELGEVAVGVVNGAGYKHALDDNEAKNLWVHALCAPLKPLGGVAGKFKLGGFLEYEMPLGEGDEVLVGSGFAGYKDEWVTLGYQLVARQEAGDDGEAGPWGLGHAGYLRVDTPWRVGLLGRVVVWDEDADSGANAAKTQVVTGLSWRAERFFEVAASGVYTTRSGGEGEPLEDEVLLLLSTMVSF
jgi:hypothetical protein